MSVPDSVAESDRAPSGGGAEPPTAIRTRERGPSGRPQLRTLASALSFRSISAAYVGVAFIVLFTIWIPNVFWTAETWKTLISDQAIDAIVAVGLVLPLAAGAIDLSIGMAVGIGSIIVAWLMGDHGMSVVPAIALAIAAGSAVGLINGTLVTRFRVDSFIATLAMASILTAAATGISGGEQIIGLPSSLTSIASSTVLGISVPFVLMLVLATVIWYVLEHTPPGRRLYATGSGLEAARLTGVRTGRMITCALLAGSTIAAFAGVLVTARSAASAPDVGNGYLLAPFAAAFLGSTQIHNGRFNVWGTVLAVYVLGLGVKGLQLGGAPIWLPDLFNGVALVIAVAAARWRPRTFRRRHARHPTEKSEDRGP